MRGRAVLAAGLVGITGLFFMTQGCYAAGGIQPGEVFEGVQPSGNFATRQYLENEVFCQYSENFATRLESETEEREREDWLDPETEEQKEQKEQEREDRLESGTEDLVKSEAEKLMEEIGLSGIDEYLRNGDFDGMSFSELVADLWKNGFTPDFKKIGGQLKDIVLSDFKENRNVLIQILVLAAAFSILLQMTSAMDKGYTAGMCFLGVYLILMLLILKLFLIMTSTADGFFTKLVEFMQLLQPVFCMSMVYSTGTVSAGVYYELLLLLITIVDIVFARILLPAVQILIVLELVNYMMDEQRFTRAAELLSDGIGWCVKVLTTAVLGLNIVQGLLAPGIDGVKRSALASAAGAVPGVGGILNSMTEILASSAMLIKNSVGVAALLILVTISFLPAVKIAVFMLLYRGCAALIEPVTDKRISAAVGSLGHAAGLYLKLMFHAVLLFFLTVAVICAATTLSM